MSCHLITGRRNAQRTPALYDAVFQALEEGDRPVFLILPEQATFQHELNILGARQGRSLWNLEITSFRRLADRYIHHAVMDTLGRNLLIYDILAQHKDELAALKPAQISGGFVEDIGAVLKEISMNGISAAELSAKAGELANNENAADLPAKLRDLSLLLAAMEERGVSDESGILFQFANLIRAENLFSEAVFCFDDFFDFTAAEYDVIDALFGVGVDAHFALIYEKEAEVFDKTGAAVSRLVTMATEHRQGLHFSPLPAGTRDTALSHLERYFFDADKPAYTGAAGGISVVSAENKKAEIRRMVQTIRALGEEGITNAEIGVCFRDLSGYEKYIEDLFASYGIPCFIDREVTLLTHPVFQYGAGLLRIAAEKWSFAAVFALLKSGLFPIAAEDCDRLENYCLAHAIKGRRFYQEQDWPYCDEREGEDKEEINAIRRQVMALLYPAVDQLSSAQGAAAYAAVLWTFLEDCRVDRVVEAWRRGEESRGNLKKSTELAAGVNAFGEMLDQIVAAFPERSFGVGEFLELLKMGAATVSVKTIPQESDAVEIYLLGASRPPRKRVVLLGGVNEGVFPAANGDGGFLNSADRTLLREYVEGWVQDKTFFYESENLLTYQALTMATERLILSYARHDGAEAAAASPLIDSLYRLFPALEETVVREGAPADGIFGSLDEVFSYLPRSLRDAADPGWEKVKDMLSGSAATADRTAKVLSSLVYTGQSNKLSPVTLATYPGREISLSVSSLELFRRCPFSYFARYGLRLKERKILQFTAPDLGNIFHEALRELLETMKQRGLPWEALAEAGNELISGMVAEKLARFAEENLFPPEHLAYVGFILGENLRFIVEIMAAQAAAGDDFVPFLWEVPFGRDGEMPPYDIVVDGEGRLVHLNGVIDRVDVAERDGARYFRIIDYKSSDKELTLDEIYYGLKLQLPVYLMVMEKLGAGTGSAVKPAGIFYQSLKDAVVREQKPLSDEEIRAKLANEMQLKGYIIGDGVSEQCFHQEMKAKTLTLGDHDRLISHTHQTIKEIGKDIFEGRTEIRPYQRGTFRSCDICPYRAVCGYEAALMGREEQLPAMGEAAAKNLMGGKEGKP